MIGSSKINILIKVKLNSQGQQYTTISMRQEQINSAALNKGRNQRGRNDQKVKYGRRLMRAK